MLWCAAHALSMACDSLYAAWLKAHYPYQFYLVMLKNYTEKGNKEKIASIIAEMKKFWGIQLQTGKLYQDNRDWTYNEENKTISQSISSMKFVSDKCAEDLYRVSQGAYATATDVFYETMFNTSVNARQMDVLLKLNYFSPVGTSGKLVLLWDEFRNGKNRITKGLKEATLMKRLAALRDREKEMLDTELPTWDKAKAELEYVGLPLSSNPQLTADKFLCIATDDKYSGKITLYSLKTGKTSVARIKKDILREHPNLPGTIIVAKRFYESTNRMGKKEYWLSDFEAA